MLSAAGLVHRQTADSLIFFLRNRYWSDCGNQTKLPARLATGARRRCWQSITTGRRTWQTDRTRHSSRSPPRPVDSTDWRQTGVSGPVRPWTIHGLTYLHLALYQSHFIKTPSTQRQMTTSVSLWRLRPANRAEHMYHWRRPANAPWRHTMHSA